MDTHRAGISQVYSQRDRELIGELIKSRLAQKAKMEYEELEGYELPPRTQFPMLSKPAVSIKYQTFTCSMACIRLFEGVKHVFPIINREKKRLAIVPCAQEESSTVEWAREKDGKWLNKAVTSLEFVEKIYALMEWDRNCRYKVLGRISDSAEGLILVFDLKEAIFFDREQTEYEDPKTGKIRKRRTVYYPDIYKDRIGKSFSDYVAARQMTVFEYLDGYVGQSYQDAPQEKSNDAGTSGSTAFPEKDSGHEETEKDMQTQQDMEGE